MQKFGRSCFDLSQGSRVQGIGFGVPYVPQWNLTLWPKRSNPVSTFPSWTTWPSFAFLSLQCNHSWPFQHALWVAWLQQKTPCATTSLYFECEMRGLQSHSLLSFCCRISPFTFFTINVFSKRRRYHCGLKSHPSPSRINFIHNRQNCSWRI